MIWDWSPGEANSGKPGVRTTIWFEETDCTMPSLVTPLTVNCTRVVDTLPVKRPPFSVRGVPPSFGPKLGLQEDTNARVLPLVWKTTVRFAAPVLPPTVAVARTFACPAPGPHSAVTAMLSFVTTEISGRPFWPNEPKSVEKLTLVPSGTGAPLRVTVACTSVHVPAGGLASFVTSRI